MVKKIYYAIGIYKGGGLTILKEFLKKKKNEVFYFDSRLDPIFYKKIKNYKVFKSNFINLIKLQYNLLTNHKKYEYFFINGLPPIFKFKTKVYVLFQNANIFPESNLKNIKNWILSRDFLRFIIFIYGRNNVSNWVVLSNTSYLYLQKYLKIYINILRVFFFEKKKKYIKRKKIFDFIYPADLKPHKNHKNLIRAFLNLANKKVKPSLVLTLTKDELVELDFNNLRKKINIYNFDYNKNDTEYFKLLTSCKCLIYPSLNETTGLPLIEAYQNNLDIICANLPYAKQFINATCLFNPYSVDSIVRNLNKYLKIKKKNKNRFLNIPNNFLIKHSFFNDYLK